MEKVNFENGYQHLVDADELVKSYHESGGYLADRMGLMEFIEKLGDLIFAARQDFDALSSRRDKSDCAAGARHQAATEVS